MVGGRNHSAETVSYTVRTSVTLRLVGFLAGASIDNIYRSYAVWRKSKYLTIE